MVLLHKNEQRYDPLSIQFLISVRVHGRTVYMCMRVCVYDDH